MFEKKSTNGTPRDFSNVTLTVCSLTTGDVRLDSAIINVYTTTTTSEQSSGIKQSSSSYCRHYTHYAGSVVRIVHEALKYRFKIKCQ